jgi:hypothetical protein
MQDAWENDKFMQNLNQKTSMKDGRRIKMDFWEIKLEDVDCIQLALDSVLSPRLVNTGMNPRVS